jgi:hypothetical protein
MPPRLIQPVRRQARMVHGNLRSMTDEAGHL